MVKGLPSVALAKEGERSEKMKLKLIKTLLLSAAMMGVCGARAATARALMGDGTAVSPYEVSTWQELSDALAAGGEIVLVADVTASPLDTALVVSNSVSATLDLNGHIVDRGLAAADYDGCVVKVNGGGRLTITDGAPTAAHDPAVSYVDPLTSNTVAVTGGVLTGGWNDQCGGGVYIEGGIFTLDGGSIVGNRVGKNAFFAIEGIGGGVYMHSGAFNMSGGAICGNRAVNDAVIENRGKGGGVYAANGTVTLGGGTITGNEAYVAGGGVHVRSAYSGGNASLYISGGVTVAGNAVQGAESNVHLEAGGTIFVAGALTGTVGVTMAAPGVFTSGLSGNGAAENFTSDDAGYAVSLTAAGEAQLEIAPPAVKNVAVRQRWPWNGLVDVDYEVGGWTKGLAVEISFAEQGGAGHAWVATNFLACAEPSAKPGAHRATWNTAADGVTNVVAAEVVATVRLLRLEMGAAAVEEASADAAVAFRMDTREGPFESTGTETLTYSSLWHGTQDSSVTILRDGAALADAQGLTGESNYVWRAAANGTYTLTHFTEGPIVLGDGEDEYEPETAVFVVTGLTQPFAAGDIVLTDYSGEYDGAPHTIGVETNAIEGLTLRYASGGHGAPALPWGGELPQFIDVTNVTVWVVASAPGYFTTTNSATVTISAPRDLEGTIEWKLLKATGTYFAQVNVTCPTGLASRVTDIRYAFADRIGEDGKTEAALWDTPSRAAKGETMVRDDETYRYVALDPAQLVDGGTATFGVSDLDASSVPVAERTVELYVRRRVEPVSGNEEAANVENFVGYLLWTVAEREFAVPLVAGEIGNGIQPLGMIAPATAGEPATCASLPSPARLNASLAVGVMLDGQSSPYCRLAAFAVEGEWITGTVEVGATRLSRPDEVGALGANATVALLGAASPAGPFTELGAVATDAVGAFAFPKPEGAQFFKLRLDIEEVLK